MRADARGCARRRRAAMRSRRCERGRRRRRLRTRRARVDTPREVHRGRPRRARCRAAAARTCRVVRSVCAASATPYAPAAPSAGAPRTASVAIASISCVDGRAVDEPQPRRAARAGRAAAPRPSRHSIVARDRVGRRAAPASQRRRRAPGSVRSMSDCARRVHRRRPRTSASSSWVRIQNRSVADRVEHLGRRPRRAACPLSMKPLQQRDRAVDPARALVREVRGPVARALGDPRVDPARAQHRHLHVRRASSPARGAASRRSRRPRACSRCTGP